MDGERERDFVRQSTLLTHDHRPPASLPPPSRYYMEKNEEMKEKIEGRYVDGVGGIRAAPKLEEGPERKDKKNFGGKAAGISGRKDKGVKNAKRMTL